MRDDILTADDPRAVRLGYADNAIAAIDWNPDGALLAALSASDDAILQMAKADDASLRAVTQYAATPPGEFKEFGSDLETEHQCPKCGYRWSGGKVV